MPIESKIKKKKEEDGSSSSSSESDDSETEELPVDTTVTSGQALTLVDDDSPLLIQPKEEEEEGEGEPDSGLNYADFEKQYEFEGEGDEENRNKVNSSQLSETPTSDKKKKKRKRKKWLYICLSNCKYDVVRKTSRKYGFKEVSEDDSDWTLYWTDYSVALERVMDMKKYQKINHFPGMSEICRKDLLSRNLNRMYKLYPKEYNVFPKTWCLPADHGDFQSYTRQKKNKTYILKPESGCQGKGIWVTKNPKEIKTHEHQICQVYLNKPFLIDGFKFDFRLYVVVTSCDPLRIFLFKDGLARFATNKYSEPTNNNSDNVYMHLTNYAINKHSSDFIKNDDEAGSKRRITTIMKYLKDKGHDVDKLWDDIDDVIIKTMISAHSVLKHNYRTCFPNHVKGSACFEILGFDILLDRKLRPLVLEVNHSPSFNTDAQIDRDIKGTLVWDTLNIVNFGACDRRKCIEEEKKRIKDRLMGKYNKKESKEELEAIQAQYLLQQERYEVHHCGNLRRIYPKPGCEKYDKYFQSSGSLFQETAAFKARSEIARQQREEILRKKEKQESMLKGKKKDGLRPESPNSRKRKALRRTTMPSRKFITGRPNGDVLGSDGRTESCSEDLLDTKHPMDILEEEELERISGLLQRDNLVRGLGIVEHVYRLLHCTPGTMSAIKTDSRILSGPTDSQHRKTPSGKSSDPFLTGRPPSIRIKDRQYYKKLLDRYFGSDHVLSNDNVALKYERTYPTIPVQNTSATPGLKQLNRPIRDGSHHFPQLRLSYSSANNNKLLSNNFNMCDQLDDEVYCNNHNYPASYVQSAEHDVELLNNSQPPCTSRQPPSTLQQPPSTSQQQPSTSKSSKLLTPSNLCVQHNISTCDTVPTCRFNTMPPNTMPYNSNPLVSFLPLSLPLPVVATSKSNMTVNISVVPQQYINGPSSRWNNTGSLASIFDRSTLGLQRNKLTKKAAASLGGNRYGPISVLPEPDYRNYLENEVERNHRVIVRSSNDWRGDLITPVQKTRVVSAHTKRDLDLPRFTPHLSHGLSVISAPAPVIQRPDLAVRTDFSSPNTISRISSHHSLSDSPSRSTKSQRVRGASNNIRLRQIEMRENHAFVYS